MSESIVIAQLSDIHLGPIPGIHPRYWNLKRTTGFINWQRNRRDVHTRATADRLVADARLHAPDHIALTGDIINLGLPAEMEMAARWLATVGDPAHVAVIPGNHDIYTSIGRDQGLARWAPYMAGERAGADLFPFVRQIGHVALIGLNSAIETPMFIAAGRLGSMQLEALARTLDALGRERATRVVMIHHPPLPGQNQPSKALGDAAELEAVLARHGAELVIHGHNHRFMHTRLPLVDGRHIPIIGVPSASIRRPHGHDELARYHLYRFTRGEPIVLAGRGLTAVDGAVEAISVQPL